MKLAEFVKQQRKYHRLTQVGLAEKSGVGIRFIRELESSKPTLRLDKVNTVLNMFGHTLEPVPQNREQITKGDL